MADRSKTTVETDPRFGGIARLYGDDAVARLGDAHVMVIGLGGVGSWTVEALARSGVGRLTLVDLDEVCMSNINRQIHATDDTVGRSKAVVMSERVAAINPRAIVDVRERFFTDKTADELLSERCGFVVDAIDSFRYKVMLTAACRRRDQPVVVCGSAGGRRDATKVETADLAKSYRDGMLQLVRKKLRDEHGFEKRGIEPFGVPAVFCPEPPVYPDGDGGVTGEKPRDAQGRSVRLSCEQGLGAASFVAGTIGLAAAGLVVNRLTRTDV